jgi:response regulator RpfG family c-di-GMP phosphodiesterase
MVAELLRELQFNIIEAEAGLDTLRVLQSQIISLLITNVGLPGGMDGSQLAQVARIMQPDLNALLITGYAENAAVRNGLLGKGMEVMTKPFNMQASAAKVQQMADR